ncbi:hypothetical protein ACTFIU_002799 [Dictyostelium citrinum]
MIILSSLLVSTVISSFVIFTLDMWRVRLQIYSVIKRFYTYYYHLLSQENIFKANKNSDIQECFIDEFGWIVLIKGVTIDIISSILNQSLYYLIFSPILLWKSKPIEYYNINNNNDNNVNNNNNFSTNEIYILKLLKNQKENYYSIFTILLISIIIGSAMGMIQYITQYYKIKLQFRLDEKLQTIHKNKKYNIFINPLFCLNRSSILFYSPLLSNKRSNNNNKNKKNDQDIELLNNFKLNQNLNFTEKVIKEGLKQPIQLQSQQEEININISNNNNNNNNNSNNNNYNEEFLLIKYINNLYSLFGDSLLSVVNEIFYNFVFLCLFNYLNYFQSSIYSNVLKSGSNLSGISKNGNDSGSNANLFIYLINYFYYRSTIIPLLISSLIAVTITQPLVVFQTQLEAFQFSNLLLNLFFKSPPYNNNINNSNNNNSSNNNEQQTISRKDEDLISYPKKFKKLFLKNQWIGIIGRLLYNPLKIIILSLWFDFLLSL